MWANSQIKEIIVLEAIKICMQRKRKYTLRSRAGKIVDSNKVVNKSKAIKIVILTHEFLRSKNRHKK